MKSNTINKQEIAKFSKIASEWWNPEGKFKPLHKFNPTRIKYIKNYIIQNFKLNVSNKPLKKIDILDIGCGGGLLAEPSLSSQIFIFWILDVGEDCYQNQCIDWVQV